MSETKTSSASQTHIILIVGEITSEQYQPARLAAIEEGFKPKVVRLTPSALYEECENRMQELFDMCINGEISESEREEQAQNITSAVAVDMLGATPECVFAVVSHLQDEDEEGAHLSSGLFECGIHAPQWLVGWDGEPARLVGDI